MDHNISRPIITLTIENMDIEIALFYETSYLVVRTVEPRFSERQRTGKPRFSEHFSNDRLFSIK